MNITYEAMGFHESLPNGRCSGELSFGTREIIFGYRGGGSQRLPFEGLKLRLGGANDRLIFFEHAGFPGWSIYTSDHSVLDEPAFDQHPQFATALQAIRKKKRTNRTLLVTLPLVLLGLLVLVIGGIMMARPWIAKSVAQQIPVSWETSLGEMAFEEHVSSMTILDDPALKADLEAFTQLLTQDLPETEYTYEFHIAHEPSLNAFALPGGTMVIHTGAIMKAETGEEILGILAHEIAHVTERHSVRAIVDRLGIVLLVQLFLGDATGLAGVAAVAVPMLTNLEFSRENERDADRVGLQYLNQANINPEGLIQIFERLHEIHGSDSQTNEVLSLLSTHPTTDERIAWLREQINDASSVNHREDIAIAFEKLKKTLEAHLATR